MPSVLNKLREYYLVHISEILTLLREEQAAVNRMDSDTKRDNDLSAQDRI